MVGSKSPMAVDGHVLSVERCGNFLWWRWWTEDETDTALQHSALQSKKERIRIKNRRNQVVQSARSNWYQLIMSLNFMIVHFYVYFVCFVCALYLCACAVPGCSRICRAFMAWAVCCSHAGARTTTQTQAIQVMHNELLFVLGILWSFRYLVIYIRLFDLDSHDCWLNLYYWRASHAGDAPRVAVISQNVARSLCCCRCCCCYCCCCCCCCCCLCCLCLSLSVSAACLPMPNLLGISIAIAPNHSVIAG